MGDQLLAVAHEDAVLDGAGGDAPLHALDEHPILPPHLVVEGEEVVDPVLLDVGAEEVVEKAVRAVGRERHDRSDREIRPSGEDVDPEVRPEEMELRAWQLVGGRHRLERAVLGREAAVRREHVRIGRGVDELTEGGMGDLAVVALEEVLAHDLPVRLDLGLPTGVVDERVDVEAELGDLGGE